MHRGVAKLGIALGSGPRGRGFESRHSDHAKSLEIGQFRRFRGFFVSIVSALFCAHLILFEHQNANENANILASILPLAFFHYAGISFESSAAISAIRRFACSPFPTAYAAPVSNVSKRIKTMHKKRVFRFCMSAHCKAVQQDGFFNYVVYIR